MKFLAETYSEIPPGILLGNPPKPRIKGYAARNSINRIH